MSGVPKMTIRMIAVSRTFQATAFRPIWLAMRRSPDEVVSGDVADVDSVGMV